MNENTKIFILLLVLTLIASGIIFLISFKANKRILKLFSFILFIISSYGIYYYFLLPEFVILRSDDFGYIDSFLKSIRLNRIVTSDWLEPYNFFSTTVMMASFFLTKSMSFSTYGMQLFFSVVYLTLLFYLTIPRWGVLKGSVISLILVTTPVFMNISLDITGVLATWLLFLGSVIAWQRKRINLFYILAFLAFTNRPSSVALIAFPIFALVTSYLKKYKITWVNIVRLCVFCALIGVFHISANTTLFRQMGVYKAGLLQISHILNISLPSFIIGLFTCTIFFAFFSLLDIPKKLLLRIQTNSKKPLIPILVTLFVALVIWYMKGIPLSIETPYIKGSPYIQAGYITFLLMSIWIFPWNLVRVNDALVAIIFSAFFISIRGRWWDYYYWDLFILSFFYYLKVIGKEKMHTEGKKFSIIEITVLLFFLTFNITYGYLLKRKLDIDSLKIRTYENLIRKSQILVYNIYDAPFGYTGWKLFDHFMKYYGIKGNISPSYFRCYLTTWHYRIYINSFEHSSKDEIGSDYTLVDSGKEWIGLQYVPYQLLKPIENDSKNSDCIVPFNKLPQEDYGIYNQKIFPLNDQEWNQFIQDQ